MNKERVIKICDSIFKQEIKRAKANWDDFESAKYERELYYSAIKSFKIKFIKILKENEKF